MPSLRVVAFAVLAVICVVVALAQALVSAERVRKDDAAAKGEDAAPLAQLLAMADEPHILFLESSGDTYRRVSLAPLEGDAPALPTDLWCQRVDFANGRGLCLGRDAFKGGAFTFDANYEVVHKIEIAGLASRVRVSSDGKFGSMTVFVQGHSYSEAGFSTRTAIVDMETGKFVVEDLEQLDVRRGSDRMDAIDRNFWGVTFVPESTQFYATLGTGGNTYLIHGDSSTRTATVLRENVECPSLSPDGTRIAFKKKVGSGISGAEWELHVLDLATMRETSLGEQRNFDDQAEWLDNDHVVYFLHDEGPPATIRPDLWVAATDGSAPQLLRTGAFSPSVVR